MECLRRSNGIYNYFYDVNTKVTAVIAVRIALSTKAVATRVVGWGFNELNRTRLDRKRKRSRDAVFFHFSGIIFA